MKTQCWPWRFVSWGSWELQRMEHSAFQPLEITVFLVGFFFFLLLYTTFTFLSYSEQTYFQPLILWITNSLTHPEGDDVNMLTP